MKTVKVSETSDAALDWLVAKCEGAQFGSVGGRGAVREERGIWINEKPFVLRIDWMKWYRHCEQENAFGRDVKVWMPGADWAQGGPIIEREGIGIFCNRTATMGARFNPDAGADWRAFGFAKHHEHHYGPTALIAAMRCYVTSKLGETAEIPKEFV